ncbi:hypothetical protein WR25_06488 isoform D [Diploscapter pachys]|nr:hypothetical protein WR25_06488 isoform B [Diploscapter pachys]PAV56031.1 hypothetical protein WR25_06488 isoform D [Diploscapter pachys]
MEHSLRKKVTDVVAEIARNTIDEETAKQTWTDVLTFLDHCNKSDSEQLKLSAMTLIESVPNIFGADQDKFLPGIKQIMDSCLAHPSSAVRSAAVKAYVSFVIENDEDERLVKMLSHCVPLVVEVCKHVVETEEGDDGPLQCLSDLASTIPKLITSQLTNILNMCIQFVNNPEKNESYRHSSLEVITSICESTPSAVKKRAHALIPEILKSCLLLMTEMDDDIEEWLAVDDVDEEEDEESANIGMSSLDRIACSLGGKAVFQPFVDIARHLLQDGDWKRRHAALMGLSTIGEGCQRSMEPKIETVVGTIVPFLQDQHPRVRYAACNALGQMSTDFAPTLQKKCHEKVVVGLITALIDLSCPRVATHAGAALVNFSEDCPKQVISAYLPVIMEKLEFVLENTFKKLVEQGKKLILEQVITTIASVADAAQDQFVTYYSKLMPPLKFILEQASDDRFKTLRGKTIECISLIGLAVGKDMFKEDAITIMTLLSNTMSELAPDDPQCSYMISSWTRICKVLGSDFAPFLPKVMGPVMRAASYKPDVAVLEDEEVQHDDPAWQFHSIGENKNFGIRTSGLEEKVTACDMIVCYARELKEAFAPFVDEVAEQTLTHLRFIFHDGVRSSAAETVPLLIECVKPQGLERMRSLWTRFLPALTAALKTETDLDVTVELISAVSESIDVLGRNGITPGELSEISVLVQEQLNEYEKRRQEREAEEADEDEDPEDANEKMNAENEEEAAVLARISDVVHSCFETFGPDFVSFFDPIFPAVVHLLDPKRHYADRQWSICMLDDLIEFAPQGAANYQRQFIDAMLRAVEDEYPEVRQAAAYGFGVMALKGDSEFVPALAAALGPLCNCIARPGARDTEEGVIATENAIAAVAKILKYGQINIDPTQLIPLFLSWLPTWEDKEESVHIYNYFCDLVETNHASVLGVDNSNLPRLLDIIISSFHLGAFDESDEKNHSVMMRMQAIVKTIASNEAIFQSLLAQANLDEGRLVTLRGILDPQQQAQH